MMRRLVRRSIGIRAGLSCSGFLLLRSASAFGGGFVLWRWKGEGGRGGFLAIGVGGWMMGIFTCLLTCLHAFMGGLRDDRFHSASCTSFTSTFLPNIYQGGLFRHILAQVCHNFIRSDHRTNQKHMLPNP